MPATNPGTKICSPANGSTVSSPVHVVIGTASSHPITEINVYVDNVSVYKVLNTSSVDTTVNIAGGAHVLRTQVWDTTGTIYRDSVNITVASSGGVSIAVSPTNATVLVNATQQFKATVSGSSNTSATWAVDGVTGGNSTVGTISNSGLYTAPGAAGSHTVRATSAADTTKTAQASISVVTQQSSCVPTVDPGAKICSPANGSTVSSPVHVVVGTKDTAHRITAVNVYVDNVAVVKTMSNSVDTTVDIAAGSHVLRVQAWDTSPGAIYRDSVNITVTAGAPSTTVTISPTSASVAPNATQQFSATVTGNSDTSVTWAVDGVNGGNSTAGTVSSTGLYTAPATAGSHTVTATSNGDTTKSASAAVTVATPTTTVTISPTSANIATSATKQFTATVTGNSDTSVTWSVDGVNGGSATAGTVSTTGLYTAPAAAGSHTVTATSNGDTTKSASATVTVATQQSCSPPTTNGIVVCTPQDGSTVNSPVAVQAFAKVTGTIYRFELWSDGVKVASVSNSGTMNVSVAMSAGTHAWTFSARNTDSTSKITKSITITAGSGPPTTTVTVSPSSASVATKGTQQFTATVTNNSDTSVNWSVDGVANGNSTVGTVSVSGLYTAPAATGSHTVTATSAADSTKNGSATVTVTAPPSSVTVTPKVAVLTPELTQQFTASTASTWSVDGIAGGDATVGSISSSGLYTPPSTAGHHTVTATSTADSTKSGTTEVYVSTYAGTFTYHNDVGRTGQNKEEIVLTPANVNTSKFGKVFSRTLDGYAFAQPLYVRNVSIGGAPHNVVYVATNHDSVYAFDADGRSSTPLWKRSFIDPANGITVPTSTDLTSSDTGPEAGIVSTPVIDPAAGTMYVLVRTKENGAFFQRLHAISLTSGSDKMTAVTIKATSNGSGVGGDGAGHIAFNPLIQNQRASLLLANGNIYIAWASHGDHGNYHGWLMAYDASTFAQVKAWNLTANGDRGGIWMSGAGPAADSNGFVYLTTGNGTNDVAGADIDFGDAYIKVDPSLALVDFFSPFNQSTLNSGDEDVASSGVMVVPDQPGAHPHLLIGSAKLGDIYVIDRDNMGGFHAGSNSNIVQYLPRAVGKNSTGDQLYGMCSYWEGNVYFSGSYDHLKQFTLTNGLLSTTEVHSSPEVLSGGRSAVPVVSSNGSSDGIVWVISTDTTTETGMSGGLHAYDASNVSNELFSVLQNSSRDAGGSFTKFSTPTVANGRVYVGTKTTLDVYGLLP